jgi:hypothetical protein
LHVTRDEAIALACELLDHLPPASEWTVARSGMSFDVGTLTRVRMERCVDRDTQRRLVRFLANSRAIVEALLSDAIIEVDDEDRVEEALRELDEMVASIVGHAEALGVPPDEARDLSSALAELVAAAVHAGMERARRDP